MTDEIRARYQPPMDDGSRDLLFQDEGTIVVIYPASEEGECWLKTHVDTKMTWGEGTVCEPRYALAIFERALEEGLTCGRYEPLTWMRS